MKITPDMVLVGGVLVGGYLLVQSAKGAAAAVGAAVNPINRDNIVNRGFESVYEVFRPNRSLGGDIYNWFHPEG